MFGAPLFIIIKTLNIIGILDTRINNSFAIITLMATSIPTTEITTRHPTTSMCSIVRLGLRRLKVLVTENSSKSLLKGENGRFIKKLGSESLKFWSQASKKTHHNDLLPLSLHNLHISAEWEKGIEILIDFLELHNIGS